MRSQSCERGPYQAFQPRCGIRRRGAGAYHLRQHSRRRGVRQQVQAIQSYQERWRKATLYTSRQAARSSSAVAFAQDHAAIEALLLASGVPFVSLCKCFLCKIGFCQLGGMEETGLLALPEDGPVSLTIRADLAVAVACPIFCAK